LAKLAEKQGFRLVSVHLDALQPKINT